VSTEQATVDFIMEQARRAGAVSSRKMFGEYALYCDGKVVALICDDQLFIKPTEPGRAFLGEVVDGAPYPGAKPYFQIDADRLDDAEWVAELVRLTARALPAPAPKKKASPRSKAPKPSKAEAPAQPKARSPKNEAVGRTAPTKTKPSAARKPTTGA
jgi:DNA transformation protein